MLRIGTIVTLRHRDIRGFTLIAQDPPRVSPLPKDK